MSALPDSLIVCVKCGRTGPRFDGPDSLFRPNRRDPTGRVVAWRKKCRFCLTEEKRQWRANLSEDRLEEMRRRKRERHAERMLEDPAYREQHRLRSGRAHDRWLAKPGNEVKAQRASRDYQRRMRREDPKRVNEDHRLNYALRQERNGKSVRHRTTVVDFTQPRVEAWRFQAWLVAYSKARKYPSRAVLARELKIGERRIHSVLNGEYRRVALDVVDRALLNARAQVFLHGHWIVTLEDLYPLE